MNICIYRYTGYTGLSLTKPSLKAASGLRNTGTPSPLVFEAPLKGCFKKGLRAFEKSI